APALDKPAARKTPDRAEPARERSSRPSRLTSWEERELDGLPDAIGKLEAEQETLAARLADGSIYRDAPEEVDTINARVAEIEAELESLFERWEALEDKRQQTEG